MGRATPDHVTERRLAALRDLYAAGDLDLALLERHVETVLRGEQPDDPETGLPFMADPALSTPPRPRRPAAPTYSS